MSETREGKSAKKTRGPRERAPPQRRIFGHAAIVTRGRGRADARKEKSTRYPRERGSSARAATAVATVAASVVLGGKKKEDG